MKNREAVRRILVVELWNIGDVVLAMPFLAQLRALFPDARIVLLAQPHARALLEGTNLVDEFIETDLAWINPNHFINPFRIPLLELSRVVRELRKREFDLAFQARAHLREHLLLGLSGAKRRVGRGFGVLDGLLTDRLVIPGADLHKADEWLLMLAAFGGPAPIENPALQLLDSEKASARQHLADLGIAPGKVIVGIHPGASVAAKRWPLERFQEVARTIASRPGVRVVAFVDPAGYGAPLGDIPGVAAVKVELRELMALLDQCSLLVCNDSGPMHVAAALGIPTVAIFSSGISHGFSPLGEGHELVTDDADIGHYSVTGISIERVLHAVERKLAQVDATASVGPRG